MSTQGENEKPRATAGRLEWQGELDSAMRDIDSKLKHPRRRASDAPQPMLPEIGNVELTSELLDEIAWRVAQQMRRAQAEIAGAPPTPAATAAVPAPVAPPAPTMPSGVVMVIRVRWPLFHWPFRLFRRRRHRTMITFSDYRIT